MKPLAIWRVLLGVRIWLLIAAFVALLATVGLSYRVSLSPPGLGEKQSPYGIATTDIFIDSQRSALGDLNVNQDALSARAVVYAELAKTDTIRVRAAHLIGVPATTFDVATVDEQDTPGGGSAGVQAAPPPGPQPLVVLTTQADAPLLEVRGQGPNARFAQSIADAFARALTEYVENLQARQQVVRPARVELRQLATARGGMVVPKFGIATLVMRAVGIWVLLSVCIVVIELLRRRAREERELILLETPGEAY